MQISYSSVKTVQYTKYLTCKAFTCIVIGTICAFATIVTWRWCTLVNISLTANTRVSWTQRTNAVTKRGDYAHTSTSTSQWTPMHHELPTYREQTQQQGDHTHSPISVSQGTCVSWTQRPLNAVVGRLCIFTNIRLAVNICVSCERREY